MRLRDPRNGNYGVVIDYFNSERVKRYKIKNWDQMKKQAILLSLFLIFSFTSAQEIINNPAKQFSKNAGRILILLDVRMKSIRL